MPSFALTGISEPVVATRLADRLALGFMVFVVLATAILSSPPKWLNDFDQSFYLTIAYDLDRHGVFSNGVFDDIDSTIAPPKPGMFFGPLYPSIVFAAMKLDGRFAEAARCAVENNRGHREGASCEVYATPIHILHALFLSIGVIAIAGAGETIFRRRVIFWLAGAFATMALVTQADLFSYVMTESTTFGLYGLLALLMVMAYATGRIRYVLSAGLIFGLLCLTRTAYVVLFPVLLGLIFWNERSRAGAGLSRSWKQIGAFALVFLAVLGPWTARNAVSVGKLGITEEYGSASLIERFAFNDMKLQEFVLAFPYCLPMIGAPVVDAVFGEDAMRRFHYNKEGSFFEAGRDRRNALLATHAKLDPIIGGVVREELQQNWWRYLLVTIPLAWCGMWAGSEINLVLIPLFAVAGLRALRTAHTLFLSYGLPALVMLGLHAAVANHYARHNLILIGPFSIGAALVISPLLLMLVRPRRQGEAESSQV